ncbi:MAG: hypothetical protein ABSG86_25535 [Thermoguttaceae bacterium]|jgi:hypothetical protein
MQHLFTYLMRWIETSSPQQWAMALALVIVVGLVCLRGFGSRSQY